MSQGVCPWWFGYFLTCPLRRLAFDPAKFLAPYVQDGMTVLEPGPGMGFFTLELARLVGPKGRIIAVDVQPKMLSVLAKRAKKAGVAERILLREPVQDRMGIEEFGGQVDFVLAFAVVHELPDMTTFFQEAATAMKNGGRMLLAEPSGHVKAEAWSKTLLMARKSGLKEEMQVVIPRSHAVVLTKGETI